MSLTILQNFGCFIANTKTRPANQSRDIIRDALIDIYGCMLIGSQQSIVNKAVQAMEVSGLVHPAAKSKIYGRDLNAAPAGAVLINSISAHALEYDDWEEAGNTHISSLLVPAILATPTTNPLSGEDFIDAYAVGYEVIARIGEAVNLFHYERGWHSTATIGALGVAASVSRLLGLNADQSTHALAIATTRAHGFTAHFGSEAKPVQAGFAAEGGFQSAMLAAAGLTANTNILEHEKGFVALMADGDIARFDLPMSKLGRQLAIDEYGIVFKPWPSCGYTHRIMTGMLELFGQGLKPDSIEAIKLHLPAMQADIVPFLQPANRSEALFSLPYCASMIFLNGTLRIDDLARESWNDQAVKNLISKISILSFQPVYPEKNYHPQQADRILVTGNFEAQTIEIVYPLGTPQNPLPLDRLKHKFFSNSGISAEQIQDHWQALINWTEATDILSLLKY